MERPRYDGFADWYDSEFQPLPLESPTWEVVRSRRRLALDAH
jgi:hypothetical protein